MSYRETTADGEVKTLQQKIAKLERENKRLKNRERFKERIAREWRNLDFFAILLVCAIAFVALFCAWEGCSTSTNHSLREARVTEAAVAFYRSPSVQVSCPQKHEEEDFAITCYARSPGTRGAQAFRCSALRCEELTW